MVKIDVSFLIRIRFIYLALCVLLPRMQLPSSKPSTSDRVRDLVNSALKEKGISGRQASIAVVGHDGLVRDIRAGRLPGIDKLEALFELLGLEFYFGPGRGAEVSQPLNGGFAQIPVHSARLAAGHGWINEGDHIEGHIAFQRMWLQRLRVNPDCAVMARIEGDSMSPTIKSGDMALIDRSKSDEQYLSVGKLGRRKPYIFAFLEDGEARVKRIQRLHEDTLAILSDNPEYPTRLISKDDYHQMQMIGRVMWWGHTDDGK